jgi:ParB-like chromosome segregation protein Spo0J
MSSTESELTKQVAGTLKFHPLAIKYGGNLGKKELDALAKDIAENGQRFPITVHDGQIIEGVQRYRACLQTKTEPLTVPYDVQRYGDSDSDIAAFIISANVHRRHLTPKQKRDIIAGYLKADPAASNRVTAEKVGTDKNTVNKVRTEMEARGEIHHVATRTDTKGRKQPAKKRSKQAAWSSPEPAKPTSKSAPAPSNSASAQTTIVEFVTFTVGHVNDGSLKLSGDPSVMREWRELRDRVQSLIDLRQAAIETVIAATATAHSRERTWASIFMVANLQPKKASTSETTFGGGTRWRTTSARLHPT